MAVRASHLAFLNLGLDARPGAAASRIDGDVCDLVADVIELENDDVPLAAVDAWMSSEIFDDLLAHLRAPTQDVLVDSSLLALPVLPIIPGIGFGKAFAAPRLKFRLAATHRRERLERFDLTAFRARSHDRERADISLPFE
jgi:hypothetical protein